MSNTLNRTFSDILGYFKCQTVLGSLKEVVGVSRQQMTKKMDQNGNLDIQCSRDGNQNYMSMTCDLK